MNGIRLRMVCIFHFILLTLFISQTKAQDSLYLVGTITGESTDKQISDVNGIGDINGDGYDDFFVSSRTGRKVRDQGIVKLYLGSADGNLIPDVTFHYPGSDTLNFFGTAARIGDINNDNYDDFAITGLFGDWGYAKGKVFIYLGGASIDTIPTAEFNEPWIQDSFGYPTEAIGDLNNDGYDDLIINSPYNWSSGQGYSYLFWGGDTISWERCDTISGDFFYPQSAANIGDVNSDSFEDLAIGAFKNPLNNDSGRVLIYYGGNEMDTQPDTILTSNGSGYDFGRIIKNAGDINGDGIIEFFVVSGNNIFLYSGINNHISINGSLLGFGGHLNIEANLDINNDGYNDFVIGNTNYRNLDSIMVGGAFVYLGNNNIDTVYKYKLEGEYKWDQFSKIMSHTDINGDGYDELLILAPSYPDFNNPLGKVYIYSYKKITDVKDYKGNIPNNFKLFQNYPNPFNPSTIINYQLVINNTVTIKLYDVLGKEIATLVNMAQLAGEHKVKFDAAKFNLSSGIYFCQLNIKGGGQARIKLVLIK